jgi:hypothetical protein
MVRHWLKVRRDSLAQNIIHPDQPEGNEMIPDIEPAVGKNLPSRLATDEAPESRHWKKSIVINIVGATATGIVLMVFIATKFIHGAWLVVVMVPLLVAMFYAIHRHYLSVARQLSLESIDDSLKPINNTVIVPISGIHSGVIAALRYAKSISPHKVVAVHVSSDNTAGEELRERWANLDYGIKLEMISSPYREVTRPLLRYITRASLSNGCDVITVVLPEFIPAKWWQHFLHNQSSLLLKGSLLFKERIIVTNVPYHLSR